MNTFYKKYFSIKQQIEEQEFRCWDAARNGCSVTTIIEIEKIITTLKAELVLMEESLLMQAVA
jgi:hypothetical protein